MLSPRGRVLRQRCASKDESNACLTRPTWRAAGEGFFSTNPRVAPVLARNMTLRRAAPIRALWQRPYHRSNRHMWRCSNQPIDRCVGRLVFVCLRRLRPGLIFRAWKSPILVTVLPHRRGAVSRPDSINKLTRRPGTSAPSITPAPRAVPVARPNLRLKPSRDRCAGALSCRRTGYRWISSQVWPPLMQLKHTFSRRVPRRLRPSFERNLARRLRRHHHPSRSSRFSPARVEQRSGYLSSSSAGVRPSFARCLPGHSRQGRAHETPGRHTPCCSPGLHPCVETAERSGGAPTPCRRGQLLLCGLADQMRRFPLLQRFVQGSVLRSHGSHADAKGQREHSNLGQRRVDSKLAANMR